MFDSLRRRTAEDHDVKIRLRELAASRGDTVPERTEEWIDESEPQPPPARPRPKNLRLPVIATAVVIVAACTAIGVLVARPEKEMPPPLPAAASVTSDSRTSSSTMVVSVVGRVPKPGLVTLPEGARVADAVTAAGGASDADALALNMARRLSDGEQVYVGIPPPPEAAAALPAKPPKVDLNTATPSQLDDLPGVGAVTAQRIIDWRTSRGPFTAIEQLRQIDGIGESRYSKLKELVIVR